MIFKKGDLIKIECDGTINDGLVLLASSNGRSLMLSFDAMIDGHVGMMPVLLDDNGVFHSIMTNIAVYLTKEI